MSELEIRSATLDSSEVQEDGTFVGRAVPYGVTANIGDYKERFERGAIDVENNGRIRIRYEHGETIGVGFLEDREDGLYVTGQITKTARGNDTLALLRSGALSDLSIGFIPLEQRMDDDGVMTRTKVTVKEISIVTFPAYEGSTQIAEVRTESAPNPEKETLMTENTSADLSEIRDEITDLKRTIALGSTASEPAGDEFRSYGEYVLKAVKGDEKAQALHVRAYDGHTTADGISKDSWYGNLVRLVDAKTPITNTFDRGALPASGMGVEFARLKSNTIQVQEQVNEGDELVYGKVAVETDNAKIKTFGGVSSLSFQTVERTTNVNLLDTVWTALTIEAAKAQERYVRSVLEAGVAGAPTVAGSLDDADSVLALLLDLAETFDDDNRSLDGLFVSKDVFRTLAAVPEERKVLQIAGAPENKIGTLTVSSITGNLAGINVRVLPGAATGTAFAYDSGAVTTLSSGLGRLGPEDRIINLTKELGSYFYATSFVKYEDGLRRIVLS